ncbi:hypothetical protein H1R20_g3083, partial [Candolleomyces eurysporus]
MGGPIRENRPLRPGNHQSRPSTVKPYPIIVKAPRTLMHGRYDEPLSISNFQLFLNIMGRPKPILHLRLEVIRAQVEGAGNDYTLVAGYELTMEGSIRGSPTINIDHERRIYALPGAQNLKMRNVDMNVAGGNIQKNIHYHSSVANDALSRIPEPVGMSWDPVRACLPGTRIQVLKQVSSWLSVSPISGSVQARIFLIADAAGSVSSFFFDKLNREQLQLPRYRENPQRKKSSNSW